MRALTLNVIYRGTKQKTVAELRNGVVRFTFSGKPIGLLRCTNMKHISMLEKYHLLTFVNTLSNNKKMTKCNDQ